MVFHRVALCVVPMTLMAGLAGCSGKKSGSEQAPPPPAGSSSATPHATHPFTGGRTGVDNPVLAVKVDNTRAAKPQRGLTSADIVYVEQVEGGLTRVMAVYSSHLPPKVGPVRSARISDLHILPQFGRPAFAYSGVQGKMKPYVAKAPLLDVSGRDRAYTRAGPHPAPYNLYGTPALLAPGGGKAKDIGFRFGAAPPGGRAVRSMPARYPAASFVFRWSAGERRWLVTQDGVPDRAAEGGTLGGSTVVIQRVKTGRSQFHDFLGNYTPLVRTVGSGRATVLRDGKAYSARWSRPSETVGTTFTTAAGQPMTFARGQVWIVLVNDGKPITP